MKKCEYSNSRLLWLGFRACAIQFVLVVTLIVLILYWVLWITAMSREEAIASGAVVPPEWEAVQVNHGKYSRFSLGTVDDHPVAIALFTIFLPPFAVVVIWNGFRLRKLLIRGRQSAPHY